MANRLPYFKWYPADAECDANFRAMDDADIGFYIRCLNHAWINGSIPADPIERARVLRTRLDVANRRWERVAKSFVNSTLDRDRMVNPRQETERESAISRRAKSLFANEIKYSRRPQGVLNDEARTPIQSHSQIQSNTPIVPSPGGSVKKTRKPAGLTDEQAVWFESWYELYPKKDSRGQAEKTFSKMVLDRETAVLLFSAIKRQRDGMIRKIEAGERKFVPHPSSWISDKCWLDEDPEVVVKSRYVTPGSPDDKSTKDEAY